MGSSFFSKDNCSNNKANLTFTISFINTTFIRKNHDNDNNKNELRNIDANVNAEFSILPPGSDETHLNRFCPDELFQKIPINKMRMHAY